MPVRLKKRFGIQSLAASAPATSATVPEVAVTGMDAWVIRANRGTLPSLVVAVRSGNGLTGYGETSCGQDPRAAVYDVLSASDLVVGRDALASEAARLALADAPSAVRGAIDIALLDLRGKLVGVPVHDLLAGRTRVKARAMAALPASDEGVLMQRLAEAREDGFRAFSVPLVHPRDVPTRGRAFFSDTGSLLARLRRAGADDLVLDCGGRATAAEAASLAAQLEPFHLMWMDEPTSEISDASLRKISHESTTPIGWGRNLPTAGRFLDLLREQVVDVIRPDIGVHGISGTRKLAALAEAYYTAVAPFHRGGPIGTAAALQVAASVPNFVIQEVSFPEDEPERRMHEAVAGGSPLRVVDGFFELPSGPGLGLAVDESALREYAI